MCNVKILPSLTLWLFSFQYNYNTLKSVFFLKFIPTCYIIVGCYRQFGTLHNDQCSPLAATLYCEKHAVLLSWLFLLQAFLLSVSNKPDTWQPSKEQPVARQLFVHKFVLIGILWNEKVDLFQFGLWISSQDVSFKWSYLLTVNAGTVTVAASGLNDNVEQWHD